MNGPESKSGYVAIIGVPNVGKSTLLNSFIGRKLSIVTPKPQTTWGRVMGILTGEDYQTIFIDTPGLLNPKGKLQEAMAYQIRASLRDADILLGLVDASDVDGSLVKEFVSVFSRFKGRKVAVANKIDLVGKGKFPPILESIWEGLRPDELVPISALKGENIGELLNVIRDLLPEGPFFYPPDVVAEQPERFFVSELIREEVFLNLRQEVPYSTAVKVEEFRENGRKVYILAHIYVERSSQKGIMIGTGGSMLKRVGQKARFKIEEFLERPVYLELLVKVRERWRDRTSDLKDFGYIA